MKTMQRSRMPTGTIFALEKPCCIGPERALVVLGPNIEVDFWTGETFSLGMDADMDVFLVLS